MSKQNLEKTLRAELELLNDTIDRKIIRGLPYGKEARRHKFILSSLSRIQKAKEPSFLERIFSRPLGLAGSTFVL